MAGAQTKSIFGMSYSFSGYNPWDTPKDLQTLSWRESIEFQNTQFTKHALRTVERVRHSLRAQLDSSECVMCSLTILKLDLLQLPCGHFHCENCVAAQLAGQARYSNEHFPDDWMPKLRYLMLCSVCHTPVAVRSVMVFEQGFEARKLHGSGRKQRLVVMPHLSEVLSRNHLVAEAYQNERRGFLGGFSSRNLMKTDLRGAISTASGEYVEEPELYFKAPNLAWQWLEEWTINAALGDPQGWMYAFNWPGTGFVTWGGWSKAPSTTTFVRRRQVLRARLCFNSEVEEAMAAAVEEDRTSWSTAGVQSDHAK